MNRLSFDHIRMKQNFLRSVRRSRLRFPRATMKKARSEEKNTERSNGGGSGVLDCVKFHSNRSRRISGCTHAHTKRAAAGRRCASPARVGGCNFVTGIAKIPHISLLRRRLPSPCPVSALYLSSFYFPPLPPPSVDSTRRLTRSPTRDSRVCIDDDECIVHCVPHVHIRARVATRSRGSSRVWITR